MDPTNANTALASAFVEELARGGLRHAVVSPGSRSTPLALALWRQPEIEVTVIVDERSAGFFALGAAQVSGEPVAVLCTSGTAAANYHPAVCEADESALPLLVLSADRPPELRGIGAGQTIDQVKLFGAAVRWFCEVGTHEADDAGLLHYRSVACRALAAARGEARPGPVHLNFPWREPLAPVPVEGAVTATDPLALEGREDRPLTAVTRLDLEPTAFLLEEVAAHIGDAISGVIVAGRQLDPELREPLAHLARVSGFPILAEPTSQLRCGPHDRSLVVSTYDLLLRDERFARSVAPELVLRFGEMPTSKPLRAWLAASGADQIVVDPSERLERADRPRGGDPARRPDRAGRGLGGAAGARTARRADGLARGRAGGARGAGRGAGGQRARRGDQRAGPAPGARPRPPRRRPRLHRLEHADPRPGELPAAGRGRRAVPLQPGRQRDRRPPLLRRSAPPTPAAGRRRWLPATSACCTTSAAWRRCARSKPRCGSSSSTTAAAASSTSCRSRAHGPRRSSRRCSAPRAASTPPRRRRSSTSPTPASTPSPTSPPRSPPAPA